MLPYSPNENRLWRDLHAKVTRNHRQQAMCALLSA
jgi:hypothetical protein